MINKQCRILTLGFFALLTIILSGCNNESSADANFPEKEITIVVPWAAGGGTDAIARQVATGMEKELGQSVIIENIEGGGGIVGFQRIANADPDGYTIGFMSNSLLLQRYTASTSVDYEQFEPIGMVNEDPATLTVRSDAPWDTAEEFLEDAKNSPGELKVSNSGPGGIWHAASLMLETTYDVEFTHVPYEGGNPAATSLAGGNVDATTTSVQEMLPLIENGDLKVLGTTSEERADHLDDIPTLKEQGIDATISVWRGFIATEDTPEEIVTALENVIEKATSNPDLVEYMDNGGYGLRYLNANEFSDFMDEEDANYSSIFGEE